jgi:hypothetical protein
MGAHDAEREHGLKFTIGKLQLEIAMHNAE